MLLLLLDRKEKIGQGRHLLLSLYETLEVIDYNPKDIYCTSSHSVMASFKSPRN